MILTKVITMNSNIAYVHTKLDLSQITVNSKEIYTSIIYKLQKIQGWQWQFNNKMHTWQIHKLQEI